MRTGKKKKKKDKDKKKKHQQPAALADIGSDGLGASDTRADEAIDSGGMVTDSGEAAATAEGGTYA